MKDHRLQAAVPIAVVLAVLLSSCGSNDAKNTLAVYQPVHVYRTDTPPSIYPGSDFIAVIGPKHHVQVMQVVQKRDHMAVRVRLSDGRQGWVFSGESIELYEPGCGVSDSQLW